MREDLKIIVAHPGRQHSFRVATALEHNGMLFKYATTVYDKDSSILMKICKLFLQGDSLNRAKKRKCPDVSDEKILQFEELRGLLHLALIRLDKKQSFQRRYGASISRKFQKKLAKYIIENDVDCVISYDTNSDYLFDILSEKAPDVIKVIDNAHPCRNYLYKVYNDKLETSGAFVKTYEACGYLLDKDKAAKYGIEAKKADIHIVASSFSKKAAMFNDIPENHIIVAPYGVDKQVFHPFEKKYDRGLKILFVGEINQRKGILQILEAAKQLVGQNVEFNLIGTGHEATPELYEPYSQYVNLLGRVSFEVLQEMYGTSHIFIFPSMGEGFGLVIPEALSSGLPVISSRNCSGPDIIKDGYNGFLIDAGSTEQLVEKIRWFMEHMEMLPQMQENALASIKDMTWEKYEQTLVNELCEKIDTVIKERELKRKVTE